MADHGFDHLALVLRSEGAARLPRPQFESAEADSNKANRPGHADQLRRGIREVVSAWQKRRSERSDLNLPIIEAGVPLLLKVDTSLDLDALRHFFQFEIVSEQEDGFVLVASEDISLTAFMEKVEGFRSSIRGSGTVAQIFELNADPDQQERLRRILSEGLFREWASIVGAGEFIVDVGIACVGTWQVPAKPKRGKRQNDEQWAKIEAQWAEERVDAYDKWDELREQRADAVRDFISHYEGEILGNYDLFDEFASILPDSFTLRVRLSAAALRDFVLNYPYIFEVTEPDEIETPQERRRADRRIAEQIVIRPPDENAPAICIIDSGLQEEHRWLAPAIDKDSSRCFIVGKDADDVADEVSPSGHGTRVAGAVLYGEEIPATGEFNAEAWIQNARVLNEANRLADTVLPAALLREVVTTFNSGPKRTRIFNHSINASTPCRLRHMSAWAAEVDKLCNDLDILFVQSAGNLRHSSDASSLGIVEMINGSDGYPSYLAKPSCRIANPAQSLQALTVGSVAHAIYEDDEWRTFASAVGDSSGFTRCGLGIWDSIKPDVVEFGGDSLYTKSAPHAVAEPPAAAECYPELLRATLTGGPAYDCDEVGTSFAAPKVTRIAARLQRMLPEEPCLLYRALIAQSARWPESAAILTPSEQSALTKRIGYGIPDIDRATRNTNYRVTFITAGSKEIGAGECHIYQVPIPDVLRAPGEDYDIRLEVTLSYAAQPRRTRRTPRGYLSTWLDWRSNRQGESLEAFLTRALRTDEEALQEGSGTNVEWTLDSRVDWGVVPGIRRDVGTLQKDWSILKSNALPNDFCIAVRGHRGWSKDPASTATYTMAVTMEIVGEEIEIYEPLRAAVLELQSTLEAEVESEIEVEAVE
jgi:hypothetical protein